MMAMAVHLGHSWLLMAPGFSTALRGKDRDGSEDSQVCLVLLKVLKASVSAWLPVGQIR